MRIDHTKRKVLLICFRRIIYVFKIQRNVNIKQESFRCAFLCFEANPKFGWTTDERKILQFWSQWDPPAQQYGIKINNVFGLLANSYVSIYIPQNKTQEDLPEDITNTTSSSPLYQGTASKSIDQFQSLTVHRMRQFFAIPAWPG